MIHPIDRGAEVVLARGPRRLRFFSDGWGDASHLEDLDVARLGAASPAEVTWGVPTEVDGIRIADGEFDGPFRRLPERAQIARVRLLLPGPTADRVVVLMAAWNDHGYETRGRLAAALARHGIGAAILENPFYGARRPDPETAQPITTVADFAAMGRGAVEEARSLLLTLRERFRLVGVAGYSMGGSIAALVSATMPTPVATAPLAAAYSPAPVYTRGVLRRGVDWEALGGEATAKAQLADLLERASTTRLPPPAHARHAVLVAARHDGFVPSDATRALHEHWSGSELRWERAGHATLLWLRRRALAAAIAASFDRLAGAQRTAGS